MHGYFKRNKIQLILIRGIIIDNILHLLVICLTFVFETFRRDWRAAFHWGKRCRDGRDVNSLHLFISRQDRGLSRRLNRSQLIRDVLLPSLIIQWMAYMCTACNRESPCFMSLRCRQTTRHHPHSTFHEDNSLSNEVKFRSQSLKDNHSWALAHWHWWPLL